MLYMALCSFMMILALSEMFRTMTAIGNGSFAGNRFIPLALVLLTLALASPFFATFYTLSRPVSMDALSRLSVGAQWAGIAAAILLLYLGLTFAGAAVISTAEELPLGACLYETASAAGTVGLTLGLTPQLGVLSQSILILLMYFGRVGGLTLIYAAFSGHDLTYARYPQEKITVG